MKTGENFERICNEKRYVLTFSSDTLGVVSNIDFKDSGEIGTRTEFPESWLWVDYKLPLCPGSDPDW